MARSMRCKSLLCCLGYIFFCVLYEKKKSLFSSLQELLRDYFLSQGKTASCFYRCLRIFFFSSRKRGQTYQTYLTSTFSFLVYLFFLFSHGIFTLRYGTDSS